MPITADRIAVQFGNFTIYWYGIFVTLGIMAAWFYMQRQAPRFGFSAQDVSDLTFTAILGGIIGARLFYVILNFHEYRDHWIEIVRIDRGGLVIFGGMVGGTAGIAWKTWRTRQSYLKTFDLFALGMPLGETIGRFGCLVNGCCFGRPTASWFSLIYPPASSVWYTQVDAGIIDFNSPHCLPVIPTQLLQSGLNAAIALTLYFLARKKPSAGFLLAVYILCYASGRFGIEFFRGDYYNHYASLTQSQVICLLLVPVGLSLLIKSTRTKRPQSREPHR